MSQPDPILPSPETFSRALVRRIAAYVRGFYAPPPIGAVPGQWETCQQIAGMIEAREHALIQSTPTPEPPASPPADADRLRREGREDVLAMLSEDLAVELRDSLDRTLPLLSDGEIAVREAADVPAIRHKDSTLDGREARQEMTRAPLTQQGAATTDEDARPAVGNVAKSQLDPSGAAASSALPSSISPAARSREGAQDWIQQRVTAEDIEGAKRIQLIAQLQQRARFLREALPHSPDFGDDRIINKSSIEAVAELLLQAAAALSRPSSSERRRDDDDLSRSPSPDVPSAIGSPRSPQPNGSKQ